jgi:hypothetical protein
MTSVGRERGVSPSPQLDADARHAIAAAFASRFGLTQQTIASEALLELIATPAA